MLDKRRPGFVLTMIVKNEGAIIGRALDAALPHCAGYVISDTGSTDDTVEKIAEAAARHGAPGLVWQAEWKNFGHNRTLSADRARSWISEQGWKPGEYYLLMLDGDMVLCVADDFDRSVLTGHAYSIVQKQPGLDYPNTRLHRADLPWKSHGVTHEFWACNPFHLDGSVLDVEKIYIDDRNDGGAKADKFERDERLLRQGLVDEPENQSRYMFYLAQTLCDVGKYREAIEWYDKRRLIPDHPDEPWYCLFRKGLCLLQLGDAQAADVLLRAYNERPIRAEPLYYLARHYREQSQSHVALALTELAQKIPYPAGAFFVETGIYTGRVLAEEIAINAWHAGKYELGMQATEDLARQRDQYPGFYEQMSRHSSFYAEPLVTHAAGRIEVPEGIRKGYSASSPALVEHAGAWYIHSRLVNYQHEKGWSFVSRDPDGVIRTRGARARWTPEAGASDWLELDAALPADWPPSHVVGAEDQRWAVHAGRVYVTANTWQSPVKPGTPHMLLGRLDEALTRVEKWWPLPSPLGCPVEKNWLPWPRDGELFLVYGYDPFTILHWDEKSESVQLAGQWPSPFAAHRFRGSAGPVPHPEKPGHHLVMVHEKAQTPVDHLYMQRLIELDPLVRPVALSVPFYIDHRGTEFPLGFAHYQGRALITYGREECESAWVLVEWDELLKKFRY